jgi:hypothetical protein
MPEKMMGSWAGGALVLVLLDRCHGPMEVIGRMWRPTHLKDALPCLYIVARIAGGSMYAL